MGISGLVFILQKDHFFVPVFILHFHDELNWYNWRSDV